MINILYSVSGYDFYFVIDHLVSNGIIPRCIFSGSKIMYMHVGANLNLRFLDSLNFLSMGLSKLSEAFGLPETKG